MLSADANLLTLCECAAALDVDPSTLRRWCKDDGAPIARPGRKGKNGAALYDVEAIRDWRDQKRNAANDSETLSALRAELPQLIAEALWAQFLAATGPHKKPLAGELAAAGHRILYALEDHGVTTAAAPGTLERLRLI